MLSPWPPSPVWSTPPSIASLPLSSQLSPSTPTPWVFSSQPSPIPPAASSFPFPVFLTQVWLLFGVSLLLWPFLSIHDPTIWHLPFTFFLILWVFPFQASQPDMRSLSLAWSWFSPALSLAFLSPSEDVPTLSVSSFVPPIASSPTLSAPWILLSQELHSFCALIWAVYFTKQIWCPHLKVTWHLLSVWVVSV